MRYITNEHPDHRGTWVVCDDEAEELVVEILVDVTYEQAVTVLASGYDWLGSLTAAGEEAAHWEADPAIAWEGVPTSDRRQLEPNSVTSRQLPQPLMWNVTTTQGHQGAMIAGAVDEFERRDGGVLWAAGRFDTGPMGQQAAQLVGDDIMRGVSVDLAASDVETEVMAVDEAGRATDWLDRYTSAELAGLTGTPHPAFADARIKLRTADASEAAAAATETADPPPLPVAAAGGPAAPPVAWYRVEEPDEPTPWTVLPTGQAFGHLAIWGTCHIGHQGVCVTPPMSSSDYAYFHTGSVRCDDGCEIPVGQITMGTGHAGLGLNHQAAASHYDHTGFAAADLHVTDGKFGPWACGAVRQMSDDEARALAAAAPSGDWRSIGGSLEMVAVLAVNVPGFPVPRPAARVASGQQLALVAAASPSTIDPLFARISELETRIKFIECAFSPLAHVAVVEIDARMGLPDAPPADVEVLDFIMDSRKDI